MIEHKAKTSIMATTVSTTFSCKFEKMFLEDFRREYDQARFEGPTSNDVSTA